MNGLQHGQDHSTPQSQKQNTKKSSEADGVTFESIKKNINNKFTPILTIIYNTCLHFQRLLPEWNHGVTTLVSKGGNASNCEVNNIDVWRHLPASWCL